MSRLGKMPVAIVEGVSVKVDNNIVEVTGPKGSLKREFLPNVKISLKDDNVIVEPLGKSKFDRSYFGTARQLINNMVEGVTKGFQKDLQLFGIGYKAAMDGKGLKLSLGYSHPVHVDAIDGVEYKLENPTNIKVIGIDKEKVGLAAAIIKSKRKVDRYKGKGVREAGKEIKLRAIKKSD